MPTKLTHIDFEELKKLPYVNCENPKKRILPVLPYFDGKEWVSFIPSGNKLIKLKAIPVEGDYFAKEAESDSDILLGIVNLIIQRAYWPDVGRFIDSLRNDIHNLGASLGKLQLFYEISLKGETNVSRFVSTEVEYIFIVCRSIFDLLQEIIASVWDKIELTDKSINKCHIPRSFSKMVKDGENKLSADSIENKYRIPPLLAHFYAEYADFFLFLRNYRDKVTHWGFDLNSILITEKGFAIRNNFEPFKSLNVWNKTHLLKNNLASLRPIVAYLINYTIKASEDFSQIVQKIITFPPNIAQGYNIYLRGHFNDELNKIEEIINKCLWWDE